ncbi:response regulator transcription factor [Spirosoma sp. KCTC 42546]|uniref:LytR/AlgR family response regulator transcription factor n=1 Tax=Spirosoma sp. KCTC 42546 TaxID=2520506 RepID=UPI00115B76F0|nr:LytTR family DNA-binding domain-containing protein [Spirosoma sp. KCTC 42546]QDK81529.1 response regulator transcription factor [Spirosoma sp. KCTC 42546]
MNVLIIEDEAVAARQLKAMVERAGDDITVLAVLDSIERSVAYLQQSSTQSGDPNSPIHPDLILLDIELSDGQSFAIFNQVSVTSPIIFTTAYDEFALRAFEVNSVDYLLKPIQETALRKALQKFRQLQQTYGGVTTVTLPIDDLIRQLSERQSPVASFRDRFLVHVGQRLLPIDSSEVAYFYSMNKLTFLKTHTDNQYILNYSLDELEKSLDPRQFYRANRQFIVGHKAVQKLHLYFNSKLKVDLRPTTEEDVLISREKAMAFRQWLGE